ncbi:CHAT domain-containing tetratricopeptide repeat protein [Streptomyces sp. PvR034]|uniref:CHAT domain-containing protein n=1 Tax=Streptomyces sp. PvR034 TaxID=3156401 RepID=UPI003396B3A3
MSDRTGEVHRLREEVFRLRQRNGEADPDQLSQLAWECWGHQLSAETAYVARCTIDRDAVDGGDPDRLVYARALLIGSLNHGRRLAEAAEIIDRGEPPTPGSSPPARFQLHLIEGVALIETGRYEEALARFRLADAHTDHVDSGEPLGVLELNRGAALNSLGRYDEAITAHHRALAELPAHRRVEALSNLANALAGSGRTEDAERAYREAFASAGGKPGIQGNVLSNLAKLLMAADRADEAATLLRDALDLRAAAGDVIGQARSHALMSVLLIDRLDFRGALDHVERSLALSRGAGVPDAPEVVERARDLTHMVGRLDSSPDEEARILAHRMRRAVKVSDLRGLLESAPAEVLRRVGPVLERERRQEGGGEALKDLVRLVQRVVERGPQMAIAEFTAQQVERNRLIAAAREFLASDSWLARKRYYESHREALESEELRRMLPGLAGRPGPLHIAPRDVEALLRLVVACREEGVDMAFARLPPEDVMDLVNRFVQVGTWRESLALLQAHPAQLLGDEVARVLERAALGPNPMQRSRLRIHLEVLRQCRLVGPEAACAAAPGSVDGSLGLKSVTGSWSLENTGADPDDPFANIRAMAEQAAASGDEESEMLALLALGQAYLDRTEGDRRRNLERARRALSRQREISWSMLRFQTFAGTSVRLGTALLELSRLSPPGEELLEEARSVFGELLGRSDGRFPAWNVRSAARGMYETLAALEAAEPALGHRASFRAERTAACQAAMDASDELVRTGGVEDRRAEFEQTFWACAQLVEDRFAEGLYADALLAAERGRGRGFLTEVGGAGPLPDFVPVALARREDEARSRLAVLRRRDPGADRVDVLAAERDLAHVHAELAELSPRLAQLRTGAPPTLDELLELRGTLGPGTVLLSWFSMPHACLAFALFDDGTVLAEKSPLSWADLESYCALARADVWRRPGSPDQPLSPAWTTLTDALVPRAWCARVAAATTTVLVPHGLLHELPLHVLPVAGLDGRSLIESAPVRYLPGLALGRRLDNRRPGDGSALVLAHSGAAPGAEEDEFLREAREATALLGAGGDRTATGPAARIDLIAALGPTLDALHIAAHGFFDPRDPLGSGLLLSDGTREGFEVLSARTVISRVRLNGAVVVLSGCESNRRELGPTDEGEGLVRAFLVAGARQVVASQWKVDSAMTRSLMHRYYSRVRRHADVPGAMRDAALELRGEPDTAHPYYWGPFVVVGV